MPLTMITIEMSYRINDSNDFDAEIHRIIGDQVTMAVADLRDFKDIHSGVHNARRRLKVARAALRLIRKDLGETSFKKKNAFCRDMARRLSQLRDATAMLETIDFLEKSLGERLEKKLLKQLRLLLDKEREYLKKDQGGRSSLVQEVADNLEDGKLQITDFKLSKQYRKKVLASLQLVYARGQNAFKSCYPYPTAEKIHEWRKRAKYLRYQFQMLEQYYPTYFQQAEKDLHQLTDLLGDYQNLSVLCNFIISSCAQLPVEKRSQLVMEALEYQQQLHQKAKPLGKLLYSESPNGFLKRLKPHLHL